MRRTLTRRAALRTTLGTMLAAAAACGAPALAQAPAYPNRPIKIICAFPVGGIADTFSRLIGQKLGDAWGQPVVIENRTGAGGNIGADAVAKSPNDGYTILMSNIGTHAVNVHLLKALPFDPVKDFVPIAHVLDAEGLLVVHPSVQASSVKELVALAKSRPGRLNYSSAGSGTNLHIAAELFKNLAGVSLTHVPYKGGGPALAALLGNEAQLSFLGIMVVQAHQDAGRMRAIAVTSPKRSAVMPDVPTIVEGGVPGYAFSAWYGVLIPAAAPNAIVATWNSAIVKALRSPDMADRIAREGADVIASSPVEFGAYLKTELAKWAKVVKDNGLKVE